MQYTQSTPGQSTPQTAQQPLVSVILPCYNAGHFLHAAIASVVHQSYRHLEIIVINDGSTDDSDAVIRSFMEQDPRIQLISHEKNAGIIARLNEGIAIARGDFICRMDGDDVSAPERISIEINFLLSHPAIDLVSTGFYFIYRNGKQSIGMMPKATLSPALKFFSLFATPVVGAAVLGKTEVFRKSCFDKDYLHSEDYDRFSSMALSGASLHNLVLPLYGIRLHQGRVSFQYESQQIKSHLKISARNITGYFGSPPDPSIHVIVANRFTGTVLPNQVLLAFEMIQKMKQEFYLKEACSAEAKKEIEAITAEQQVDILIQAIKNADARHSLPLMGILFRYTSMLLRPGILKYLWLKVRIRISG